MFGRPAIRCGRSIAAYTARDGQCQRSPFLDRPSLECTELARWTQVMKYGFIRTQNRHLTSNSANSKQQRATSTPDSDYHQSSPSYEPNLDRQPGYRERGLQKPTKDDQLTMFCRIERALSADRTITRRAALVRRLVRVSEPGKAVSCSVGNSMDSADAKADVEQELHMMSLRELNLVASDILGYGAGLPAVLSNMGMKKAASARSTNSLSFYLTHARRPSFKTIAGVVAILRDWVEGDDFAGLHGALDRKELLALLTGYAKDAKQDGDKKLASPLCSMLQTDGDLTGWDDLLACVFELGDAEALLYTWETYLKMWESVDEAGVGVAGETRILDIVIQRLCQSPNPAPGIAWKIAAPHLDRKPGLNTDTLEQLLSFPDMIDRYGGLRSSMEVALKRRLVSWAQQIEEDLGVAWEAGTGKHLPAGENAASMLSNALEAASEMSNYDGDPDYQAALQAEAEKEARSRGSEGQRSQEQELLATRRQRREQFQYQQTRNLRWSQ